MSGFSAFPLPAGLPGKDPSSEFDNLDVDGLLSE